MIPGTSDTVKDVLIWAAPVAKTSPGLTDGVVCGRLDRSLLAKRDCPTEENTLAPSVWKTVQH